MVRPTYRFSASKIAERHVAAALELELLEEAGLGPIELGGGDAVAEEAVDLLVDARDDLVDVDRVIDREDHQGAARHRRGRRRTSTSRCRRVPPFWRRRSAIREERAPPPRM